MAQRKNSRGHRHPRSAAGSSGSTASTASRALHSVIQGLDIHSATVPEQSIWGRRRVLLLNSTYEPLTALPMRRAVIMLMCGKADVVHDDPMGPVIHSASRTIVVPSVIRLRSLRPGSLPRAHPDDEGGTDASGQVPVRVLRGQGRHRRSRHPAQPWRCPLVGELRRRMLAMQPPQGRPVVGRARVGAARDATAAEGTALAVTLEHQGARPGLGQISG